MPPFIASFDPIKTRVMDFHAQLESLQVRMHQHHSHSSFGESFIAFAIDAPKRYRADNSDAEYMFFIDPIPITRTLDTHGYQIVADPQLPSLMFHAWAKQVIDCIQLTICGDWPARDLCVFRSFLQACTTRQLSFIAVDFNWAEPLHALKHSLADFNTLYVVIAGVAFPDLNSCATLENAIQAAYPNIKNLYFGNEIRPKTTCQALLLGEFQPSTSKLDATTQLTI